MLLQVVLVIGASIVAAVLAAKKHPYLALTLELIVVLAICYSDILEAIIRNFFDL